MSEWLISLEGTEAGRDLALALALLAAFLHAVFGALQKGRFDPWLTRGAVDIWLFALAAPIAIFVVPLPEPHMWPLFAGAVVIHVVYKVLQAAAYTRGAYTVVYPVVRGTGPLFTVFGAYLIFSESFTATQWLGVTVLLAGIFGLALYNLVFLVRDRETLPLALFLAVMTGLMVALYTTYDAYAIRATADPFSFIAWFFMFEGMTLPAFVYALAPDARSPRHVAFVATRVCRGDHGLSVIRLDHVGDAAGQSRRSRDPARDVRGLCGNHRMVGPARNRWPTQNCLDGIDCIGRDHS